MLGYRVDVEQKAAHVTDLTRTGAHAICTLRI
ncbi:MAG: hypothetical protein JWP86_2571 [Phenylobacterium sp.]|nr:hypothetical protein [Phenylobacterium sp.]